MFFFSKRAGHAKAQRHSEHYARFRFRDCTQGFAWAGLDTPPPRGPEPPWTAHKTEAPTPHQEVPSPLLHRSRGLGWRRLGRRRGFRRGSALALAAGQVPSHRRAVEKVKGCRKWNFQRVFRLQEISVLHAPIGGLLQRHRHQVRQRHRAVVHLANRMAKRIRIRVGKTTRHSSAFRGIQTHVLWEVGALCVLKLDGWLLA